MPNINGTSSADTITVSGDSGTINGSLVGSPITEINTNNGYDSVTITNSSISGTVSGGSGGMEVDVSNSSIGQFTTTSGQGQITAVGSTIGNISAGSGDVSYDLTNTDITGTVNSSGADVTLTMNGGTFSGSVIGGAGSNTFTFIDVDIADATAIGTGNGDDTYTFENTSIGNNFEFEARNGNSITNISGTTSLGTGATFDAGNGNGNQLNFPDGTVLTVDGLGSYTVGTDTLPSGSNLNGSFVLPNGSSATFTDFDSFGSTGAPVCFTEGTSILTPLGEVPVEALAVGDLVTTIEGEAVPVRWIYTREVVFHPGFLKHRPVQIGAGMLGEGVPANALAVSPQHCVMFEGPEVSTLFGVARVLARAKWLTACPGVRVMRGRKKARYVTFMLDSHRIVRANGAWTESFFPGPTALSMLSRSQRNEIESLCPKLRADPNTGYGARAARVLTRAETERLFLVLQPDACRSTRSDLRPAKAAAFSAPNGAQLQLPN
ncbi:MAG: Hint domain-containing protein [Pseudomonadota bacterium]